jgi:glucosamine-6-phosphate deaminase
MKKLLVDNLEVLIFESRLRMGTTAAEKVITQINILYQQQDFVNIIFAAAPSQYEFLAALIADETIDWSRVNAFHMDEYIGLPNGDERKFASFLSEKIFSRLPFHTINYLNGNAADLQEECERYTKLLSQYPTDIVCMGIGENGHIAFNDPHVADFNDPAKVKIVSLDAECRQQQVNDGCFANLSEVPTHALTLTIPALMAANAVYCMVPGEKKANAVFSTLNKPVTELYPASILRKHKSAILFLDSDSSALL